jgi:protein involved in polysaccharide export with SLBB domain
VFLIVFTSTSTSTLAHAQVPSPQQAQQMLRDNPALIARLQQMLRNSGLTPEQIRQRLRAQGYSEAMLDAYLPGNPADSTALPSADVFSAIRALGIADSTQIDSLGASTRRVRLSAAQRDSIFLVDTLQPALKNDTTKSAVRRLLQRSRTLQRAQTDSGYEVFGLDLFQNETTQFDPNTGGGADANYRFGPGDRLVLFLTGEVEKSMQLTVTRDGFVVIPAVGQVNVAGLTRAQLEDALYGRLGRVYSGVRRGAGATTHFYIDVAATGTSQVFVNGDVAHPGSYRVSRAGTVMNALYQAGGPTANGSMRTVQVKRNGETVATLDIYDYALRGDASRDVRLESNDVVFVPPRGPQARIAGAVLRPATYELKQGQSLADAIQMAGGFTESADRRRIFIERIVPPPERKGAGSDRHVVDVPADLFDSAPVRPGDVIRVVEISRRLATKIDVKGNVWNPGVVEYRQGMHLSEALQRAGGLKPDTYLGQVLVARLRADSTRTMLHTALFDTTARAVDDLTLADGDEITIFSTTTFRPNRYISIVGAVRTPGQIPFRDGMTLRDAVLLADGLQEGASLIDAEVARLPENRAGGITAVTQRVALDSSYLFERSADGRALATPAITIQSGTAREITLQPYDAVLIKRQPEWQLQQTVAVRGEVKYPGEYSLTNKTERLSDILTRAGGLTTSAYPGGIVFVRKNGGVGRIGIDLPAVLRDNGNIDNLALFDGDSIFIPQFAPVVAVRGAVNSPVGVAYVAGANIDYYIRAAGGANAQGDAGRAYVTQGNGKVESRHRHFVLWSSRPDPLPGSTVVVPAKDPSNRRDWVTIATVATSILGPMVTIFAILKR